VEAVLKYQLVTQADRELHEALKFAAANIRPRKSRSEFMREAIAEKIIREIPDAFNQPNIIAAE
jgi:hypothetical protein